MRVARQCCGVDANQGWDYFELLPDAPNERCQNEANHVYRTDHELIPLCSDHHDHWSAIEDEAVDNGQKIWKLAYDPD
jgi:hypothetical protein